MGVWVSSSISARYLLALSSISVSTGARDRVLLGSAFLYFQAEDGIRDLVRSVGSEMCIRDSLTPLELTEVQPGVGFRAKDLWTGEERFISERIGSVSYTHLTLPTSDLV